MKVRDIMTAPALTCAPETSVAVAARRMKASDYGSLPVVDRKGQLVGIVTDRDMCLALADTTRNALNIAVREAMTPKVRFVRLDDDAHDALAMMKRARIRRLPVCDHDGRLQGMLSIEDVVVRGLEAGGITIHEIVDALRGMYVRTPAAVEPLAVEHAPTPG
jgi:CBS domain-containing protein